MAQPPETGHLGSSPQMTARLIHVAISFSVVMLVGVFLFLRSFSGPLEASEPLQVLRWAGYVTLVGLFVVSRLLRARIHAPAGGTDMAQWWTQNLPKAITFWAILEALGLAPIVMGWLSGSLGLLMAGAFVSLILLFFNRPGALETPV
jgi:hypothetical protein